MGKILHGNQADQKGWRVIFDYSDMEPWDAVRAECDDKLSTQTAAYAEQQDFVVQFLKLILY